MLLIYVQKWNDSCKNGVSNNCLLIGPSFNRRVLAQPTLDTMIYLFIICIALVET